MCRILQYIPKIDLHRHLEGSIKPEMVHKFSEKNGKEFSLKYLRKDMQIDKDVTSLADFIAKLGTKYLLQYSKTVDDLATFSYEVCKDAAVDNIIYMEMRSCPQNHVKTPLSAEEFMEGVIKGCSKAENEFDIKVNQIITLLRRDNPDTSRKMLKLIKKLYKQGKIVGVDLAGDESVEWESNFVEIFKEYKKIGIPITIHAGEVNCDIGIRNLEVAVKKLNASRIGHGIAALRCDKLSQYIKENDLLLEVCMTSNVHTRSVDSVSNHPLSNFISNNLNISLNSDDPVTSDITLTSEYTEAVRHHQFDLEKIKKVNLNSIDHAFLSPQEKKQLKKTYLSKFNKALLEYCNQQIC